jgi:serine/threonine protein kinase/Flp pilus assembly protein TadD
MISNPPNSYEQLSPEEAAQIDAICDRFEQAWKKTQAGGPVPCLTSFIVHGQGSAHEVLLQELIALEQTCRERYGLTVRPAESEELGGVREIAATSVTNPLRSRANEPTLPPPNWPSIPGLVPVELLGSGGMGVVFKARQATLNRDVAVKLLRDDHRADSGRRERFLQEARAVARLRHPHLVQVYEFGEVPASGATGSRPYLVLEYVSGGSLADLLRGSPQPPAEAARLVETIADAIHYAHEQGVIHRDLKPANVLLQRAEGRAEERIEVIRGPVPRHLTADLCAKVTDFGLAKILAGSDLTQSGDVLGTPCYMAPEQASGKVEAITTAVDVYGLGAILYETLTGRPPFAAATVVATLGLVRQDEPVPPRRLQPTVPRDLETICLKCLRKEAGRRYATAKDLADDLRRFRAGEPVRARPVGTSERVVSWCRRNPGVAGLLAALLLVFLAGVAGVLWQWHRASRERDIARQQKERAEQRLQTVCDGVERLNRLGRDLLHRPGLYRTGQTVLEEALAFYQQMLPQEAKDPRLRRQAATLFRQVAEIHHYLGQSEQAADAFDRQAHLLTGLLSEEPTNKALLLELADTRRWQANKLRDLGGRTREAQEFYDQAAQLEADLLRESPDEARYQMALANTLLNTATLLWRQDQAEKVNSLYFRALKLYRAAVRTAPNDLQMNTELALGLENQGLFFLDTGRLAEAEDALREAVKIHQELLASGRMKSAMERCTARTFVGLGRILAAAGRAEKAEEAYREAVKLLEGSVEESTELALRQAALAQTLANLAKLLKENGRRQETEEIRRRIIGYYAKLRADFPEHAQYKRHLALSHLALASLLWELDQPSKAAESKRKALELDREDAGVNNDLAWFLATNPEPGLRDTALAVRLAKEAVTAQPKSGDYRNTLGVAHYRNGNDKAAIAELEKAMSLRAGGDSFEWFFLAMAHWRLGERDKARMWFDRAVQWMDRNLQYHDELRRFRAEAEGMLPAPGTR